MYCNFPKKIYGYIGNEVCEQYINKITLEMKCMSSI